MFGHKKCWKCDKIGHKDDMIKYTWLGKIVKLTVFTKYFHEKCLKQHFGIKKCTCGKSWIPETVGD